jgi:acetyl esterase/lipase
MTFSRLLSVAMLLVAAAGLAGCSRLGAFDAVIPKDGGTRLVAQGLSYGPDRRQNLDIYAPASSARPAPVIVFVYGGSWNSGSRDEYGFVGRAFASRGYVTVIFDYRLVPAIRYPVFVEDSAKALAWVYRNIRAHGGDPRRLFLAGHSAGAYNAVMVALAPEFLAAEGLDPGVIRGVAGLSGPYDFLPLDVDETREAFKGTTDLERTQPVRRIRSANRVPPMLLAHGDADTLVFPRNTRALASALRRHGHRVEEKYYPDVDHVGTLLSLAKPLRDRAPALDDIVAFFGRL